MASDYPDSLRYGGFGLPDTIKKKKKAKEKKKEKEKVKPSFCRGSMELKVTTDK